MKKFAVGDKVQHTCGELHELKPEFYPPKGTVGVVNDVNGYDDLLVQWPEGTTSQDDLWFIPPEFVEKVN